MPRPLVSKGRSRRPIRALVVVTAVCLGVGLARAQNENETIGFRPNHIFESSQFGESFDMLNGGLNLSVPIGPRFQVDRRLGYQLNLFYNSKVQDTSLYSSGIVMPNRKVLPREESPFGIGFTGGFGRIYEDIRYIEGFDISNYRSKYTVSWNWVAPDGSVHEFFNYGAQQVPLYTEPNVTVTPTTDSSTFVFARRRTNDLSFVLISGPDPSYCPSGIGSCFKVETPDGLVYTLEKRVDCVFPLDPTQSNANRDSYPLVRIDNVNFCGWYTTRIEDQTIGAAPFPQRVTIAYDQRLGFEHALSTVTDSDGRTMTFSNCEWAGGSCSNNSAQPCNAASQCGGQICIPLSAHCTGTTKECTVNSECSAGQTCDYPAATDLKNQCIASSQSVTDRSAVATYQVSMPAFGANASALQSNASTHAFIYQFTTVKEANLSYDGCFPPSDADPNNPCQPRSPGRVLQLVRVDYPDVVPRAGATPDKYSLYFGYNNQFDNVETSGTGAQPSTAVGNYGEVTCRTLPILRQSGAAGFSPVVGNACSQTGPWGHFMYTTGYYRYIRLQLSGGISNVGFISIAPGGISRQVISKRVIPVSTGSDFDFAPWRYRRDDQVTSNPSKVIETDPFLNDTVFFYNASLVNLDPNIHVGPNPDDGFAPDWDDGLNYEIDYYEGSSTDQTGRLVRSVLQDYDSDSIPNFPHIKDNVRVRSETTRYADDGNREKVVSRNNWDGQGHWGVVSEGGFEVDRPRITRESYGDGTGFTPYQTGNLLYREVSDGMQVSSRVDNLYISNGNLQQSIARATLGRIAAPLDPNTWITGDLKTFYTYSTGSGNVIKKQLYTNPGAGTPDYTIQYTYGPSLGTCATSAPGGECGGYLATKTFLKPDGSATFYSIKRDRDANTGLVMATYEAAGPASAGVSTTYGYDKIGRLTDVTPQDEDPTQIDYPSLRETTVTRGSSPDFEFTRYRYDGLGRQIVEEKRPFDPTLGFSCRTTKYDLLSRVTFKSEWSFQTDTNCVPGFSGEVGMTYSFQAADGGPSDPFDRVRREIPADANPTTNDKVIQTSYFGTSSKVQVNSVRGLNLTTFPAITTYFHDALGRLVFVQTPAGNVDGGSNAIYAYDALDDLIKVDLSEGVKTQSRWFAFDGLRHLKSEVTPEGGPSVYGYYDGLGNLLSVKDALGNQRRFTYDFAGRPDSLYVLPAGGTSETKISKTFYDTVPFTTSTSGYSLGKTTEIDSFDEGGVSRLTESLVYGGRGGRLSSLAHQFGEDPGPPNPNLPETTAYTYNSRGQIASVTYPIELPTNSHSPLTLTYGYQNGAVVSATDSGAGTLLAQVSYAAGGGVAGITMPGGVSTQITYDVRNRPFNIMGKQTIPRRATFFFDTGIQYDGAGNVYRRDGAQYAYDAANRLVNSVQQSAAGPLYIENFSYDAFGNMSVHDITTDGAFHEHDLFSMEAPGTTSTNRIVSRDYQTDPSDSGNLRSAGSVPFVYDAAGNLIQGGRKFYPYAQTQSVEDVKGYDYTPLNYLRHVYQISSAANTNGKTVAEIDQFYYDSRGNRILRIDRTAGLKTYYVRDQSGQVLSEFMRPLGESSVQEWQKDYIYIAGRILGLRQNQRPQPVRNLAATQSAGKVTLTWDESTSPKKASYAVYVAQTTQTTFSKIGSPLTAGFADPTTYTAGQVLYYRVAVVDTSSNESASAALKIVVADANPPSAPTLSGVAADGRVYLTWIASTDSSGIAGYEVDRRKGTDPSLPLNPTLITGTTYMDLGLTNGQTYYYQVRAKDTAGNFGPFSCNALPSKKGSPPSCGELALIPQDITPPSPPQNVRVGDECPAPGATLESIRVSWDPSPGGEGIANYQVYRGSNPSTISSGFSFTVPGTSTTFVDQVAPTTPPTTWYYAVKALDGASPANASEFSSIEAIYPRDGTKPSQARVWAKGTDGLVTLTWLTPVGEGAYKIYRKPNASTSCADYTYIGDGKSGFIDGGMDNNVAYDYAVTSTVSGVESGYSRRALAVPLARPFGLTQCQRYREVVTHSNPPSNPKSDPVTDLQWEPPSARPYQPAYASNVSGTLGYLKGYHLYHQQLCNLQYNLNNRLVVQDNSMIRELVTDPLNYSDPYLIGTNQQVSDNHWEWEDPRFYAEDLAWLDSSNLNRGYCQPEPMVFCIPGVTPSPCPPGTVCNSTRYCTPPNPSTEYICKGGSFPNKVCQFDSDCPGGGTCVSIVCATNADCNAGQFCTAFNYLGFCSQNRDWACKRDHDCPTFSETCVTPGFSPPYGAVEGNYLPGSIFDTCQSAGGSLACGLNCMAPKAVYKVYAEGTWLTAESGWPDYFNPLASDPNARCAAGFRLQPPIQHVTGNSVCFGLPQCRGIQLNAPGNLRFSTPSPGTISVSWDPVTPLAGGNVAGYYVYARDFSGSTGYALPPLPFVTVPPGPAPTVTLTGLGGGATYKVNVASFDDAGHVSMAFNGRCGLTGETCSDRSQCTPLCGRTQAPCPNGPDDCGLYGRCFDSPTISCRWALGNGVLSHNPDCPGPNGGGECDKDTCDYKAQTCDDTTTRTCSNAPSTACQVASDCTNGARHCSAAGTICTKDSDCPINQTCDAGTATCNNNTTVTTVTPIAASYSRQSIWSLNDGNPKNRKGIRLSLASGGNVRLYRSTVADAPYSSWCALLKQPSGNQQSPTGVTPCIDPNAFSYQISTQNGSYWDLTATPGVVYYYRAIVNPVLAGPDPIATFNAAPVFSAEALPFDDQVPPPPTGFKAWAPRNGNDMIYVYLDWCQYPLADAKSPDATLPPTGYTVYRSGTSGGPYDTKAVIPASCLTTDNAGNRNTRCEIYGPSSMACDGGPTPGHACNGFGDTVCGTGGTCLNMLQLRPGVQCGAAPLPACALVDTSLLNWPSAQEPSESQNLKNLYYVVTTTGKNGRESLPSFENTAYPNYRSGCQGGANPCVRRDADGDGQFPACGPEGASLEYGGATASDGTALACYDPAGGMEEDGISGYPAATADPQDAAPPQPENPIALNAALAPYRRVGAYPNTPMPPVGYLFYHLDHLGSIRYILDANGVIQSAHDYLPFGDERPNVREDTLSDRFFTGHERDKESGLDYMLARYYSPSLARLLSVDPLLSSSNSALPQSWNRYSYAWNNPVLLFDPTGEVVQLTGKTDRDRQDEFNYIKHSLHDDEAASQLSIEEVTAADGSVSYQVVVQGDSQGFANSSPTAALISEAIGSSKTIEFGLGAVSVTTPTGHGNSRITINPEDASRTIGGVIQSFDTITQHEFGHATGIAKGAQNTPGRELGRVPLSRLGTNPEALAAENNARAWYVKKATQQFGPNSVAAHSAQYLYGKPRETH